MHIGKLIDNHRNDIAKKTGSKLQDLLIYSRKYEVKDYGLPLVAMHWEHHFNNMVGRYNSICKIQMPNITPHVCRHTYCSNQARAGMNPKTLRYLMGHSDIGVTMNTYTHLGLDDARDEIVRLEELVQARKEIEKTNGKEESATQTQFRAV